MKNITQKATIKISNQQEILSIKTDLMEKHLQIILDNLDKNQAEVSILIVDDEKIAEINQQYRNIKKSTNVLAFAQNEGDFAGINPNFLGDIVISSQTIQKEAKELGYQDGEMLYYYLIHGLLHLLGYDHTKSEQDDEAQEKKNQALWELISHEL